MGYLSFPTTTISLAMLGGFFSFASTGLGSVAAPFFARRGDDVKSTRRWLDFAMGVMLSSVAFSLLGPELIHSLGSLRLTVNVALGAFAGAAFVLAMQALLELPVLKSSALALTSTSRILLASVLILHGFPEGMGVGASLAGMSLHDAIPLQAGLAAQNFVEGALLTLCFVGFGWSWSRSIVGGVLSGVVEWTGAGAAGLGLQYSQSLLSPLLAAAGGAMLMSVVVELRESKRDRKAFRLRPFLAGLSLIPLMNLAIG